MDNIYSLAGMLEAAYRIRESMKSKGVKKELGLSWIEIGSEVRKFRAGDRSHPVAGEIYNMLRDLTAKLRKMACIHDDNFCSSALLESGAVPPNSSDASALRERPAAAPASPVLARAKPQLPSTRPSSRERLHALACARARLSSRLRVCQRPLVPALARPSAPACAGAGALTRDRSRSCELFALCPRVTPTRPDQ
ncbi:Pentatricopeptide repeat-containing protein [Apostasia shenzhenica]|uniref:Pentatricopeptide repeat-containing protein n=1 Tax=Apostasia shenzhenica TaxID=1088818 RepID=A0A2I0AJ91_9ASPA|nr:Pentatricopeptide repeat-containing protein [Apostasia shenzhenica]